MIINKLMVKFCVTLHPHGVRQKVKVSGLSNEDYEVLRSVPQGFPNGPYKRPIEITKE